MRHGAEPERQGVSVKEIGVSTDFPAQNTYEPRSNEPGVRMLHGISKIETNHRTMTRRVSTGSRERSSVAMISTDIPVPVSIPLLVTM